jgi:hypothetical protein
MPRLVSLSALVTIAVLSSACSGGGTQQSGLSTASILGEAPAAASGDRPGIRRDDPMARPVQVAWTSARAQKCGFNFDPARLKANYIASEQRSGADAQRLAMVDKSYDMTVTKIKSTIGNADSYCSERTTAAIKSDLTRHLAGNFEPNFPEDKAQAGFLEKAGDNTSHGRWDPKTAWRDIEDRKNGVRTQ